MYRASAMMADGFNGVFTHITGVSKVCRVGQHSRFNQCLVSPVVGDACLAIEHESVCRINSTTVLLNAADADTVDSAAALKLTRNVSVPDAAAFDAPAPDNPLSEINEADASATASAAPESVTDNDSPPVASDADAAAPASGTSWVMLPLAELTLSAAPLNGTSCVSAPDALAVAVASPCKPLEITVSPALAAA